MALDPDCQALAQQAIELDERAPLVEHEAGECEHCAEYYAEYLAFSRNALPKLARGYISLAEKALEAFETAQIGGHFLDDLEEDNRRLQKELAAREAEIEELQQQLEQHQPVRRVARGRGRG